MLYKLLKANEWIIKNYERLCRNEFIDCHVFLSYNNNPLGINRRNC